MPTRTSVQSGFWDDTATWGAAVPTNADPAVIAAAHTVTIRNTSATAAGVTINGTLLWSRSASATLSSFGNVVGQNSGIIDMGRSTERIPASVTAQMLFSLNEATYVGGGDVVLSTDVGLWMTNTSQLFAHGAIKDTWTKLAAAALAGASSCTVVGIYTEGWAVGDRIAIGSTYYPSAGFNQQSQEQSEVRTITSITGAPGDATRVITFSGGTLVNNHTYTTVPWTDKYGDAHTEILTAEVINLSANIIFDTVSGTNTNAPHIMFLDSAKFFVNDIRINNFSPRSKVNPMGRYIWHAHHEENGSAGSYAERVRCENAKGGGLFNHESWNISYSDWAMYNVAKSVPLAADQIITPFFLESTIGRYPAGERHDADNCRFERFCVMKWGVTENLNSQDRNACYWLGFGSINCNMFGSVCSGGISGFDSGGFVWPEGTHSTMTVDRIESHSNDQNGTFVHMNVTPDVDFPVTERQLAQTDWLMWRNYYQGTRDGAYITNLHLFFLRDIGNAQLATGVGGPLEVGQVHHSVTLRRVTNFLLDGENGANGNGIRIAPYVVDSTNPDIANILPTGSDSLYEDGVIQNIAVNRFDVLHGQTGGQNPVGSAISQVAFNRVSFSGRGFRFGNGTGGPSVGSPPFSSRVRFRAQTGMGGGRPANFTLYNIGDPAAPGGSVTDGNALRADNDTAGNGFLNPRAHLTMSIADDGLEPAADAQGRRLVTLTCATRDGTSFARPDAHSVVFYRDHIVIATITPNASGDAIYQDDIATHPYRRAYYKAKALYTSGANSGGYNMSAVLRVRRGLSTTLAAEPTAPTLSAFTSTTPTTLVWTNTDVSNELGYEYSTSPNGSTSWTVRGSTAENNTTFTWSGASPATTYHGKVSSIGPSGTRYDSNVIGPVTTAVSAPAAPLNPRFTSVTQTTLNFLMTDNSGGGVNDETFWHMRFRTPPTSGTYGATTDQATSTGAGTGATVTFAVVGLTAGTPYEFEGWASNGTGDSTRVTNQVTTTAATPNAPTLLLTGTATSTTMPLSWTDNASNETAYEVEFKRAVDSTYTVFSNALAANTVSTTVTGLTTGTLYNFRVRCRNGVITSGYSNVATASTANPPVPVGPTNLAHGTPTTTTMPLTWTDNATDETAYRVEFKLNSEPTVWTVFSSVLAANSVSSTVTGLTANTLYDFRVACSNASGLSAYSNIVTIDTAATVAPTAPSSLATGTPTLTTMPLTWTDNAVTEDAYHVEYRIQGESVFTVATTALAADSVDYTVTGLNQATTYEFRVRCALTGLNSAYSNTATGTTLGPPDPGTPTLSSTVASSPTQIDCVWTNVSNENGYDLESSPTGAGTWTVRTSFAADSTSGSWTAAVPATTYDIRIVAFRAAIRVPSSLQTVTTPSAAPAVPTNVRFANITQTTLDLIFTDASGAAGDAETAFNLRYRDETDVLNPSNYTALDNQAPTASTGTSTTVPVVGLSAGRTYRFGVRATNATGSSAYAEGTVTTTSQSPPPPPPPPPPAVTTIGGKPRDTFVTLAWARVWRRFWRNYF